MGQITFEDLIKHGIDSGANIENGMPWSFNFSYFHVSHETDQLYIVSWPEGKLHIRPGELLVVDDNGARIVSPDKKHDK